MPAPDLPTPTQPARPGDGHLGAFLLALGPLLLLIWRFDFLVDDAFITFRYAANLAAGEGLVFNPGEAPPVEGYTNFLWMLAMAAVQALGLDPAVWSRVLSAACAVVLLHLVVRALPGPRSARVGASLGFATLPPVAVWATGGLETMPFALAVFATYAYLTRAARAHTGCACLAAAAAVLLRADGLLWVGLSVAAALVARPDRRGPIVRAALVAGGVFALHLLWRRGYYGEWGPNTARAKVHPGPLSFERGAKYVASLLLAVLSVPLALALGLRALAGPSAPVRRTAAGALLVFAGGCGYLVLVGGDWMMMFRQLVPTMPFVALALGAGLASLGSDARRLALAAAAVALSLLPAYDVHPVPAAARSAVHYRWGHEELTEYAMWKKGVVDIEEWILLGKAAARSVRPGDSYVLGNIGAIPFYSGLIAYDTHGLTNREPFAEPPDPDAPEARRMPGHDRNVEISTFDKYRPTLRGLKLAGADDPHAGLPARWLDPSGPMADRLEIEIIPLEPADGFPPGRVLQLIRNKW